MTYSNSSLTSSPTLSMPRRKHPNSVIDTSGLLFKPLSVPQLPQTPPLGPLPDLSGGASTPDLYLSPMEGEVWEELTVQLEAAISRGQLQTSSVLANAQPPVWDLHFRSAPAAPQGMLTLASSTTHQGKKRSGSVGELVWCVLGAGAVATLYIITPLVITLGPILSENWSRLLIALEVLGVAEFVICRILMNTSKK